jgi:hypothetical protein
MKPLLFLVLITALSLAALAQEATTFTLRIKGVTSDAEAQRLIGVLQARGQDKLLDEIRHNDLGTFSIGGNVGQTLNAVRIEDVGGKKRIRAVAERWLGFGELRGGYRSLDYPFSYIELLMDPRTGKGDGTYFGAAQIKFKNNEIQIEDFGTFPGRILNVTIRGRPLP